MIDLDLELDRAIARLERIGCVLPGDLSLWVPALGLQAIEPDGELYQPAGGGELALVVPVYAGAMPSFMRPLDYEVELIDLVAFRFSDPSRCWRRTGLANYLGEHFIQTAVTWRKRLRVLGTPLAWLNARGRGVCPLTGDYSALRCVMAGLNVDDVPLADAIERQHQRPFPSPPIFVRAAAA
jgi:hypothetical protein